ncbi:MAG: 23S rRNA (guanosine(2251)-2'-O)-methyltransferase RlmB [Candidatus Marinimicrobia bacterium]|nr:23S rRNA (guanosine(2251)-2'-O)-methyltransferase RlmB [Candidatus Neomarinimicrobiota bacterium]|tara:strand:- start:620 stop:1378 length:759 start_codon:yes stop_codon:yes gene_type:complete
MNKKRNKQKIKDYISIYGVNSVIEVLKSKYQIYRIDLLENSNATKNYELIKLINSKNYQIKRYKKEEYIKLYKSWRTQGVVIHLIGDFVKPLPNFENEKPPHCLLMTDGVEDPQNLGQIIRTSECAGINGIILPRNRSGAISQVTLQVSQGAFIYLPLFQTGNIAQTIKSLKKQGFWIIGLENGVNAKNWFSENLTDKVVIIVGGEGTGLRQLTQKLCDFIITIPMNGKINSLNVSAAVSVILFERNRQILD